MVVTGCAVVVRNSLVDPVLLPFNEMVLLAKLHVAPVGKALQLSEIAAPNTGLGDKFTEYCAGRPALTVLAEGPIDMVKPPATNVAVDELFKVVMLAADT